MNTPRNRAIRPRRATARVEMLETRQLLATFSVTSVADAGAGTLRQAILDADSTPGFDAITFDIAGSGVHTITPTSPLPDVTDPTSIDGTTQPGYAGTPLIELNGSNILSTDTPPAPLPDISGLVLDVGSSTVKGLAIDRFTGYGIAALGDGNTIQANFLGTDPTGTIPFANGSGGLLIQSRNNLVGGPSAADRNLISGNQGFGIDIESNGGQTGSNVVQGNLIGTDVSGTADLGNAFAGVFIDSSGNVVGGATASDANTIAFNGGAGVQVGTYYYESGVTADSILGNSISSNAGLGIDLGGDGVTFNHYGGAGYGPNNLQNYPTLSSAYDAGSGTTVEGTFNGPADQPVTLQFFGNSAPDPTGFGEGRTFLGSTVVTTDATGNVAFSASLATALPAGEYVTATATDGSGDTSEFSKAISTTATAQADLSVAGYTATTGQVGQNLTYSFTVTNNGPSIATGVSLVDQLPAGSTFILGQSSQGTVTPSTGEATASIGKLASGASATVTVVVRPTTADTAVSVATVSAAQPDPTTSNNSVSLDTQVAPAPPTDLAIGGSASPIPVVVGANLTYTFVVVNTTAGDQATGVTLTDALPSGVTFVSADSSQGTVADNDGTVTAAIGTLLGTANATVTIVVSPTGAGELTNTATVKGNEIDLNSTNNSATVYASVNVAPSVDLSVAIEAAPQPAIAGEALTYAVVVANTGSAPATGVVLTDILPQGVTVDSIQTSQGSATQSGGTITTALGTLATDARALVTILVTPASAGTILNQASVTSDEPDFDITNNTASQTTQVVASTTPTPNSAVDLAVAIQEAPQPAIVGQGATFVVTVANVGSTPATGVVLSDLLPDNATVDSIKSSQGTATQSGDAITSKIGDLAPGSAVLLTIVLVPGAPGGLLDQASVASSQADAQIANNYAGLAVVAAADQTPPTVVNQRLIVTGNAITGAILTFSEAMNPTLASNLANYQLVPASGGHALAIASATYAPSSRSVTLAFQKPLAVGRSYKLVVNGPGAPGVTDTSGNVLNDNGIDFFVINRGTRNRPTIQLGVPTPQGPKGHANSSAIHTRSAEPAVKSLAASRPKTTEARHTRAKSV